MNNQIRHSEGQLVSRPIQPSEATPVGLHSLNLGGQRDGFRYVPQNYEPEHPAPLMLALHGAGATVKSGVGIMMPKLESLAHEFGIILLAVDSRGGTWDLIIGQYGPDIAFIDRALEQTFRCCAINPSRIALVGFSDGASYALSVGITNGDLFTHGIAFSPGFVDFAQQKGQPRLFVSHGTQDPVLPIDYSRTIVPQLQQAEYDVCYREFNGAHTVPEAIAREAVRWFLS